MVGKKNSNDVARLKSWLFRTRSTTSLRVEIPHPLLGIRELG
jgi:hypothetical protein